MRCVVQVLTVRQTETDPIKQQMKKAQALGSALFCESLISQPLCRQIEGYLYIASLDLKA